MATRKLTKAEIREEIDAQADKFRTPLPVEPRDVEKIKDLIRVGPKAIHEAKMARTAVGQLLPWWFSEGRPFDLKLMLCPLTISTYQDFMEDVEYSDGSINNYGRMLNILGRVINPEQQHEWDLLGLTPTRHPKPLLPYDDEDEVDSFFVIADRQRRPRVRQAFFGFLYLGLGMGLPPRLMYLPRGTDVRNSEDGVVKVRVGTKWHSVRPRYARGLLELAAQVGEGPLVYTANSTRGTSRLLESIEVEPGQLRPRSWRLQATYRVWAARQLGLGTFIDQCGAAALNYVAAIHGQVHMQPSAQMDLLLAPRDDIVDGPWNLFDASTRV